MVADTSATLKRTAKVGVVKMPELETPVILATEPPNGTIDGVEVTL